MEQDNIYFTKVPTKGRPRLVLNEDGISLITSLSQYRCTDEEIAAVLNVTVDTLQARHNKKAFSDAKKRGIEGGTASLKRMQWKAAQDGNVTMLIWLGKNMLGQSDKVETENKNDNTININVSAATEEDIQGDSEA